MSGVSRRKLAAPMGEIDPVKDSLQRPVPSCWRRVFCAVVDSLIAGDHHLARLSSVKTLANDEVRQIQDYIDDYGETLIPLPDEAWDSSVVMWMEGYWDVLVDLWTLESGRSDMVIWANVREDGPGRFAFHVVSVHVP